MTSDEKTRPPRQEGGPEDETLGGGVVASQLTVYAVSALPRRDRERLLDRLAELRTLDRTMREPGLLAVS